MFFFNHPFFHRHFIDYAQLPNPSVWASYLNIFILKSTFYLLCIYSFTFVAQKLIAKSRLTESQNERPTTARKKEMKGTKSAARPEKHVIRLNGKIANQIINNKKRFGQTKSAVRLARHLIDLARIGGSNKRGPFWDTELNDSANSFFSLWTATGYVIRRRFTKIIGFFVLVFPLNL